MRPYPHYPKPLKNKTSLITRYFENNRSWLDNLFERSYTMKMGHIRVPMVDIYIPNQPELIRRILVTEVKQFPKNPLLHDVLLPLLGSSIFTTNAKVWRKQRELLNPSFDITRIIKVFPLMHDAAKDMMFRLKKLDDGNYNNIDAEMSFVTADTIFRTILSSTLSQEEGKDIIEAFNTFQELSLKVAMKRIYKIPKIFYANVEKKRIKAGKHIRQSLSNIIKPRYEEYLLNNMGIHGDILSSLLAVKDKESGEPFSFEEILDQISMLFLAGHETTASSMTWSLYLLALYPDEQEEVYKEIGHHCGDDTFTAQNTKKLDFLTKVYKETLRLYPPVSSLIRTSAQNCVMRDKKIKKGSLLIVSPWLMQRNARYWEDPHMFNPHRFDDPSTIEKYTYFPFGLGQRICIGTGFAMQESILLLASILRKYRVELQPEFTPDIVSRLTTRTMNGMPIKLIKRIK